MSPRIEHGSERQGTMQVVVMGALARSEIVERLRPVAGIDVVGIDGETQLQALVPTMAALVTAAPGYNARIASMVRSAPALRWIQFTTAGFESAQAFGVPPGVTVANAGDAWSAAVAEHAMTLLLALYRCLPETLLAQSARNWDRSFAPRIRSVSGHTLVIVGFGGIGRAVAARARSFGMYVIGVNRSGHGNGLADEMHASSEMIDVLARADAVVIAVPASAETRRLFDRRVLDACKPGAVLVNVARGSVVDQQALESALRSGHLAGAGLDVADPEPLPPQSTLWSAPNLIVSPHVAGSAGKAFRTCLADLVEDNAMRFMAGDALRHVVRIDAA